MPLALDLSHKILFELAKIRRENDDITYLRPDSKSQVTIEYSQDHRPIRINSIVISTQHDEFDQSEAMLAKIRKDMIELLIPRVVNQLNPKIQSLFNQDINYHINPNWEICNRWPAW